MSRRPRDLACVTAPPNSGFRNYFHAADWIANCWQRIYSGLRDVLHAVIMLSQEGSTPAQARAMGKRRNANKVWKT